MTDLLDANAAGVSNAFGISGDRVVGSFMDGTDTKPFMFDFASNTFTDLSTVAGGTFFDGGFAQATAVNGSGVVVGTAETRDGRRAWAYNVNGSGTVQDLNSLLNPASGGFDALTDANAITDEGVVAGVALTGVDERAFISTVPIPEAGSGLSLLIGSAVVLGITGGKRRRRK
ncbi:MAG: DUF3466 family protein, partial [Armatimonadetes bacterium]|nr:DUF3466 family protein [Armatimonadota bacterium]